jgi:hypothetical protein
LDISGVHASADALRVLSESLSRLKRVAYREMESASESCFWYLFKNLGLKCVDLRGCYKLRGRCFKLFSVELEEVSSMLSKLTNAFSFYLMVAHRFQLKLLRTFAIDAET